MAIAELIPNGTARGKVYLRQLPLSCLVIDERYQRAVSDRKVKRIVKNFRPDAIGAIDVSQRANGEYTVIDGQHRVIALRQVAPDSMVDCVVHTGLYPEDEAELFTITNGARDKPIPADRFRARLFYRDPAAVEINAAVESAGLRLDLTHNGNASQNPTAINAISAVQNVYDMLGANGLRQVLSILSATWPDDRNALIQDLIMATGMVINTYGDSLNRERLIAKLSEVPLKKLLMEGAGHRALLGGGAPTNIARAIVKHYNHSLRNRLPDEDVARASARVRTPIKWVEETTD
jgi:hypothetical protein